MIMWSLMQYRCECPLHILKDYALGIWNYKNSVIYTVEHSN